MDKNQPAYICMRKYQSPSIEVMALEVEGMLAASLQQESSPWEDL